MPRAGGSALPALILPPLAAMLAPLTVGQRVEGFVFYLLFLGPGEEILYRGYMQSRLNGVFGRPFRLLGANWGWGLVITTALFGLMRVGRALIYPCCATCNRHQAYSASYTSNCRLRFSVSSGKRRPYPTAMASRPGAISSA